MFNHFTCAVSAVSSVHVHSVSSVRGLLMLSAILGAADAALWNRFHVSSLSATAAAALRSAVSCFIASRVQSVLQFRSREFSVVSAQF